MLGEYSEFQQPLPMPLKNLRENAMSDPHAAHESGLLEDASRALRGTAIYGVLRRTIDWQDNLMDSIQPENESYDWRADYDGWKHVYPEEVFLNSKSASQSRRAMARYDQWQRDRTAQSQHPVVNFLFNCIGFTADAAAIGAIPFIGGLSHRLGGVAGKAIAQTSILRDAVVCSTAAMLDAGEVEVARVMASDFDTFGDRAGGIATNVVLAGLLGAGFGSLKGRGRVRTLDAMQRAAVPQPWEIITADEENLIRNIFSGKDVEIPGDGKIINHGTLTADLENATNITDDPVRPTPYEVIADLDDIIGKIPKDQRAGGTVFSRWMQRVLGSHVVKAQASESPLTRAVSAMIADSRLIRHDEFGAEIQSAEIPIRVHKSRTMAYVLKTLENSFEKMRKDKNPEFATISREDFYRETSKAILVEYTSANPYATEASASFRSILDEAWELSKKEDLGGRQEDLVGRFEGDVKKLETEVEKFRADIGGNWTVDKMVARATAAADKEVRRIKRLGALEEPEVIARRSLRKGLRESKRWEAAEDLAYSRMAERHVKTEEALDKALDNRAYDDIKAAVEIQIKERRLNAGVSKRVKELADAGARLGKIMKKIKETGVLSTARQRKAFDKTAAQYGREIRKFRHGVENVGGKVRVQFTEFEAILERLGAEVEKSQSTLIKEIFRDAKREARVRRKLLDSHLNREAALQHRTVGKLENREKKLGISRSELERVKRGDLTDVEWGRQTQDKNYRPRIYKIQEIIARKVEFANRIANWLIRVERAVSREDAFQAGMEVANQILDNSYTRMPHGIKIPKVRGMERVRTLDIPSLEIIDFLEDNPIAIFERLSNTIYPDFYLKQKLGDLSLGKVHKAITDWYDGETVAGRMKPVDAQKALRRDMDALNGLMASVRGISNLSGEAMMRNSNASNILGATRSINSALMLGALPTTALFDLSTIGMTFGLERAFGTALPTFLKLFRKNFRAAVKGDLAELGIHLDCLLQQHHGRFGAEFDPNLYGLSESVTGWLRDKTGAMAQFTHKWNGSLHALSYARASAYYTAEITLRNLAEKARIGGVMSAAEKNLLNTGRLTSERLARVGKQIAKFSEKRDGATVFNLEKWDNIHAKNDFINACANWSDRAILEPGFEQHGFMRNNPLWQTLFQFKSFLFAAVDRCLLPNIQRLEAGELHLLGALIASVSLGGFRDLLNRTVDGRDLPTTRQFIAEGIAYCDMLPFAGDIFKAISDSFGARDVLENAEGNIARMFLPPALSTVKSSLRGANGITKLLMGGKMTQMESSALKQCIPMNNNYIVRRSLRKLLQTFTKES
jgi:hypothetical protein